MSPENACDVWILPEKLTVSGFCPRVPAVPSACGARERPQCPEPARQHGGCHLPHDALHGASDGGVVKAEGVRTVPRFGVLEHIALAIEGLARHDGKIVEALDVEHLRIVVRGALDGDRSLARAHHNAKLAFEEVVNGSFGNLRGKSRHERCEKVAAVENERAQQINIPACISCYLGVTEPALFGVNLKYKFPMVCGMIGSALAAMVCTGFGVQAVSIGVGGIPGILSIVFQFWGIFAVCMAIAIVVAFALTYFVGLKKLSAEDRGLVALESANAVAGEAAAPAAAVAEMPASSAEAAEAPGQAKASAAAASGPGELVCPVTGSVASIEQMADPVFSSKCMGDGLCITPAPSADTVVAPADATATVTMPASNHAVGLTLDNGMELLIHVGIDTVAMGGDGFTCSVKQGDRVRAGQKLLTFSQEKICAAGHPTDVAFVVSAPGSAKAIAFTTGVEAQAGETSVVSYQA